MPKLVPISERMFLSSKQKQEHKKKKFELAMRFNIPKGFEDLFINELKITQHKKNDANEPARELARLLGLI